MFSSQIPGSVPDTGLILLLATIMRVITEINAGISNQGWVGLGWIGQGQAVEQTRSFLPFSLCWMMCYRAKWVGENEAFFLPQLKNQQGITYPFKTDETGPSHCIRFKARTMPSFWPRL